MEIAAYHEAGHAVMAIYLGGQVTEVSIESEEGWGTGNATVRWTSSSQRQRYLNDLKTALAGPIAEMVYVGDYDYLRLRSEHAADWKQVLQCLPFIEVPKSQQTDFLECCVAEIYATLRQDALWAAVGDVAELLLLHETIDGESAHDATEFWLRR